MGRLIRRMRGAFGTAVTWAVGWGASVLALFGPLHFLFGWGEGPFLDWAGPVAGFTALSGFVSGSLFSLVLGTVYRNRRLSDLRPRIVAVWGGLAALVLPAVFVGVSIGAGQAFPGGIVALVSALAATLGAGTAGGMVALAQRSDRALLGTGNTPPQDPV